MPAKYPPPHKIPLDRFDTLTQQGEKIGALEREAYVEKEYEEVGAFWAQAVDKAVDFNVNLPDDAAALDSHCFQCILAGGAYTNPDAGSAGKCNRGTGSAADNGKKPALDTALMTSDFMTAVRGCPAASSEVCQTLDKDERDELQTEGVHPRYFGKIVAAQKWQAKSAVTAWDHCVGSFTVSESAAEANGLLLYGKSGADTEYIIEVDAGKKKYYLDSK